MARRAVSAAPRRASSTAWRPTAPRLDRDRALRARLVLAPGAPGRRVAVDRRRPRQRCDPPAELGVPGQAAVGGPGQPGRARRRRVGVLPAVSRDPHLRARGIARDRQAAPQLGVVLARRRRRRQRPGHAPFLVEVDVTARAASEARAGQPGQHSHERDRSHAAASSTRRAHRRRAWSRQVAAIRATRVPARALAGSSTDQDGCHRARQASRAPLGTARSALALRCLDPMPIEGVVSSLDEAPGAAVRDPVRATAAGTIAALVRTLRPKQWVKNLFVAAPLVFSRHLTSPTYAIKTALAVLAFCALSGAVYAFNDVRDVAADRLHPIKRHRPVAAGALSERAALIWAGVLAAGALGGCLVLSWKLAAFATAYLIQNVAYTLRLKQVAFIDVLLIASGFILRVLAGAVAIAVPASGWVLLCTTLLAVFLGFGKRAHELAWAERTGRAATTRAALAGYTLNVLKLAMLVLAVVTCGAFVAYTVDPHTIEYFSSDRLILSSPFVALGIVRFLSLSLWWPKDDSPTDAMLRDPWFLAILAGAAATMLYAIYG
ncbi:MAG: hypothetical protein E6J90_10875 [Deltaproteobacteria bacterium]|nr:MAG: hypothetical protein E6J90_10875 [Deltaproteobacteria bacterium]